MFNEVGIGTIYEGPCTVEKQDAHGCHFRLSQSIVLRGTIGPLVPLHLSSFSFPVSILTASAQSAVEAQSYPLLTPAAATAGSPQRERSRRLRRLVQAWKVPQAAMMVV